MERVDDESLQNAGLQTGTEIRDRNAEFNAHGAYGKRCPQMATFKVNARGADCSLLLFYPSSSINHSLAWMK